MKPLFPKVGADPRETRASGAWGDWRRRPWGFDEDVSSIVLV